MPSVAVLKDTRKPDVSRRRRVIDWIAQVSRHWETGRIGFQNGFKLSNRGLSGEPPDSHNVVVKQRTARTREGDRIHLPQICGDASAADQKVLSEETESRLQHRHAVVVQDLYSFWLQSYPTKKKKTAQEAMKCLQLFVPPDQKPGNIHPSNSLEFIRACESKPIPIRNQRDCRTRSPRARRR